MPKKILVGLDGSKGSFKALEEALLLASLANVELHTLSVGEVPRFPGTISEVAAWQEKAETKFGEAIAQAQKMAEWSSVKLKSHVLVGHEVMTIVEFIKENKYDLLVTGFMGHSAVYSRIMGGTCQNLVRLAPCTILVVK
jgi:nucleotide-binding universal stress UspA family protein